MTNVLYCAILVGFVIRISFTDSVSSGMKSVAKRATKSKKVTLYFKIEFYLNIINYFTNEKYLVPVKLTLRIFSCFIFLFNNKTKSKFNIVFTIILRVFNVTISIVKLKLIN